MRLHYIQRTTLGGRHLGDLLLERSSPAEAMRAAKAKYPNERHQYISSMDREVEIERSAS